MVKAGRTAAGERAALSHTASLAGSYAVLEAAARDGGITLLDDPDAMLLAASLYSRFGPLPAPRVAVVTTSGGGGAIAADRLSDEGLTLAELAPRSGAELERVFMPGQALNPIDLGGRREGEAVDVAATTLHIVARDSGVDLLLLVLSTAPALARITADLAGPAVETGKPYLFVMWPGTAAAASRQVLLDAGAPFCDRLEDALRAITGWAACSAWSPPPVAPRPPGLPSVPILDGLPSGPLGEAETKALLATYGIPVNAGRLASTPDEAVESARAIGYPVALKAAIPGLIHKSDAGAVVLNLTTDDAVRSAYNQIASRLAQPAARGPRPVTVLVQQMVHGDTELIVGVKHDAQFGPVVLVGAGGVLVELLRDVQLALAPLGPRAALDLLRRLRAWPLLAGTRGRPALDVATLAEVICRVSWLAHDCGERLAELDINPLIVLEDGAVAVDARAVVR
jgi:acetyl-CoA synthetase (ADP-forming)